MICEVSPFFLDQRQEYGINKKKEKTTYRYTSDYIIDQSDSKTTSKLEKKKETRSHQRF